MLRSSELSTIYHQRRRVMRGSLGMRSIRLIPCMCLVFIFVATTAFAQFDSATVLGTIRDANGGALPGATITLKNTATGIAVTTQSDANGDYQFPNVRIGI